MALEVKKFLDAEGVGTLWGKVKEELAKKAELSALTQLENKVTAIEGKKYDDSIAALQTAVNKLNADESTAGSVAKQVADAVAKIMGDGQPDASYDTLKEIADWILEHPSSVSEINSKITKNAEDIGTLKGRVDGHDTKISGLEALIGTIPAESGADDIIEYIAYAVQEGIEEMDASGMLETAKNYTDTKLTEAKQYADGLLVQAKSYSDGNLATAKSYTDTQIDTYVKALTEAEILSAIAG